MLVCRDCKTDYRLAVTMVEGATLYS